jgi:uncharacterized membrane protein YdjX (TVP38/TMEM64 family)
MRSLFLAITLLIIFNLPAQGFVRSGSIGRRRKQIGSTTQEGSSCTTALFALSEKDLASIEESRIKIWEARRKNIRQTLRAADSVRSFRIANGLIPEIDPATGKPNKDADQKFAISLTAFGVAMGAIVLRIGGRAALVSAVGLDAFMTEDMRENMTTLLTTADSMDFTTKLMGFVVAWILTKVLCFDAAGVVLALTSGILFGGVVPGALLSAAAATLGSTVAYGLAKADTPIRRKAEQIVRDNPSLRSIDKVVTKDGLKAVLTLRLAPILPIPIGMYNYVYGVTNVKLSDFMLGIFLGSLKPYFLDSYIGYFGKEVLEGSVGNGANVQDVALLGVFGVSVLIGVFASQLATETWETVLVEAEQDKETKDEPADRYVRDVFGLDLPEWMIDFQVNLKAADERINGLVDQVSCVHKELFAMTNLLTEFFIRSKEAEAKVWSNDALLGTSSDPSRYTTSPERAQVGQGVDLSASVFDGLVLSPILFSTLLKYADPLVDTDAEEQQFTLVKDPRTGTVAPPSSIPLREFDDDRTETALMQLQDLRTRVEKQLSDISEQQTRNGPS